MCRLAFLLSTALAIFSTVSMIYEPSTSAGVLPGLTVTFWGDVLYLLETGAHALDF